MRNNFFDKKGQIGETLTWTVGTVIILVTLLFFIYASSSLGEARKSLDSNSILGSEGGVSSQNSVFAFLRTEGSGKSFFDEIAENGLGAEKENMLKKIMEEYYGFQVRFEIVDLRDADIIGTGTGIVTNKIRLSENKELRIIDDTT